MHIGPQSVVVFHYTLRDGEGAELETSRGGDPSAYLHGAHNILRGLEDAMAGRESGESFSVTLAAADAYGAHDPDKLQRVPVKHLVFQGKKLRPGMVARLNTREGLLPVTVSRAGIHSAVVDTNHPLAGRDITFDIEILEVRAATPEEVAHGHAHGPGGHRH